MKLLFQIRRFIFSIIFLVPVLIMAQSTDIKNVSFEPKGDDVIIYYQLDGDPEEEYKIECYLKSDTDDAFNYQLIYAMGDIGTGKFVGKQRKIVWHYKKEFPLGLTGDDFYFNVTVDELSSGFAWYYYIGAAVAGGTAAYLLSTGKDDKTVNASTIASFPDRP